MLRAFGHRVAMCCDMLGVVGSNLTSFKLKPTTRNMLQHVATGWPNARNMLRPTMLGYVALNVAIVWPGLKRHQLCDAKKLQKHSSLTPVPQPPGGISRVLPNLLSFTRSLITTRGMVSINY